MNEDDALEVQVLNAVVNYVRSHPQAMDTTEGIAQWWLSGMTGRVDLATLQRVLDRLIDAGVLEGIDAGSRMHYRLRSKQ